LHLLVNLIEEGELPEKEPFIPEFIDTYRRCIQQVLRPLASQHSTAALRDELARLPHTQLEKALAAAIGQFSERLGLRVSSHSRELAQHSPKELIAIGTERLVENSLITKIEARWEEFIQACSPENLRFRNEDLLVVRHFAALDSHAKRFAFLQANQIAERIDSQIRGVVRARPRRHGPIATELPDPSSYPIGGYAGITNRGGLENMLTSELAYLDEDERVDWFTVRWLNHELLYYTRDEAHFERDDRVIFLAFPARLDELRRLDNEFGCRQGLVALGSIISLINNLRRFLGKSKLLLNLVQVGPPPTGFDPTEFLSIRFDNATNIQILAMDSLDQLPSKAEIVVWSDGQSDDFPGIDLSTEEPRCRQPSDEARPRLRSLSPWSRVQAQLLSSLLA